MAVIEVKKRPLAIALSHDLKTQALSQYSGLKLPPKGGS
jgi:hypothetical protein